MKRCFVAVCLVVVLCSAVVSASAQSPADPRVGVWKLNLAKSKFSPGPAPQSNVWRFENRPDGFTVLTISGTNAQGEPTFTHCVLKYDEKDYPLYGVPSVTALQISGTKLGTMSHKIVDPYTMIATPKNSQGVAGNPTTVAVSRDGKTLTQTSKGKNAQGQLFENIAVWDRVK